MPWFKRFPEAIILKDGQELHTLNDAAAYIVELSKSEQDAAVAPNCRESLDSFCVTPDR